MSEKEARRWVQIGKRSRLYHAIYGPAGIAGVITHCGRVAQPLTAAASDAVAPHTWRCRQCLAALEPGAGHL